MITSSNDYSFKNKYMKCMNLNGITICFIYIDKSSILCFFIHWLLGRVQLEHTKTHSLAYFSNFHTTLHFLVSPWHFTWVDSKSSSIAPKIRPLLNIPLFFEIFLSFIPSMHSLSLSMGLWYDRIFKGKFWSHSGDGGIIQLIYIVSGTHIISDVVM